MAILVYVRQKSKTVANSKQHETVIPKAAQYESAPQYDTTLG